METRELLSVCHWDGGGTDNLWTTAANWQGDVAPVANDDLVFQGTARTQTQNNFAAGTAFHSIGFASSNFSLSGNALTLTSGITVDSGVTYSNIYTDISLSGPVTANVVNTWVNIMGVISGSGSLTKTNGGTLTLIGNNTYTGTTTISAGWLQLGGATAKRAVMH